MKDNHEAEPLESIHDYAKRNEVFMELEDAYRKNIGALKNTIELVEKQNSLLKQRVAMLEEAAALRHKIGGPEN